MARILIAEGGERAATLLDEGLQAGGFTTGVVADADLTLAFALSGEFDLLLLALPFSDGLAVLRSIREARCRIPVIILSGRADVDSVVAGLDGGADDYMSTPFRLDELQSRIRLRLPRHVRGSVRNGFR